LTTPASAGKTTATSPQREMVIEAPHMRGAMSHAARTYSPNQMHQIQQSPAKASAAAAFAAEESRRSSPLAASSANTFVAVVSALATGQVEIPRLNCEPKMYAVSPAHAIVEHGWRETTSRVCNGFRSLAATGKVPDLAVTDYSGALRGRIEATCTMYGYPSRILLVVWSLEEETQGRRSLVELVPLNSQAPGGWGDLLYAILEAGEIEEMSDAPDLNPQHSFSAVLAARGGVISPVLGGAR